VKAIETIAIIAFGFLIGLAIAQALFIRQLLSVWQ